MTDTIDHIYILCDPQKEPDRASYLYKWIDTNAIPADKYTMGLFCYGCDLTTDMLYKFYNPWQNRKPVERERNFNSYNLKPGEISLVLNWHDVAKQAVEKGFAHVMILESDVIFPDNFLDLLKQSMSILRDQHIEWDFLSLTAGAGLRPYRAQGDTALGWFPAPPYYHTRTTDAMIVKTSMLKKITDTLFPFAEVLDWELNYQLTLHSSRSFWLDPPILRQGSWKEYSSTL